MNDLTLDRAGGVASALCALHCLTVSLAPALIGLIGAGFLRSELFEWGFFGAAVVLALLAAVAGYRRHRHAGVLAGFTVGLVILAAARFGEASGLLEHTLVLAVLGGGVLVGSHVMSARALRAHREACCP